ncbi:hypothetical protein OESDEN_22653 [Oesophagostomum dentatum]|uniref:Uncharacterized protein n=1 Tax=Oesophagostomum dentatum TaxID=61180 RepID=A0A0B1S2L8_OESDE|nr:hypothetical protein OESDEN_22653 [Oesophagostomum dentatum]
MGENPPPDGKMFFSVERFDYTKGIKEKLAAYRRYFEKYPSRIGKDVLYQVYKFEEVEDFMVQVAVTNRRSVRTYEVYQDTCMDMAKKINADFRDPARPEWRPLVFQTEGL